MRKIREVLRLKWECQYSDRKVARSCGLSRPAVADYVCRAQAVGLSWPLPDDLDESTLEARLFPVAPVAPPSRPLPDWATVHRELTREGVTLMLSGRNTRRRTPRACNTANSVNATGPMPAVSISRCVRCIGRARSARRLCRAHGLRHRPAYGRDPGGPDLCRRARRQQLHLLRGDMDSDPARLDRLARAHAGALSSGSGNLSARQSPQRGHPQPSL